MGWRPANGRVRKISQRDFASSDGTVLALRFLRYEAHRSVRSGRSVLPITEKERTMAETKTLERNPKKREAQPPFPGQQQEPPGSEKEMEPKVNHGEESYKGNGRLLGKAVLITGADSGIGRAVALAFAREGADVLITYLEEEDDARETERLVREAGRKVVCVGGDLRDEKHCQALVQRAFEEFGHLDVLVNNAAFQMTHESIEDWSSEEWDRTFRTNIYAMFYLCKAAVPRMKAGSSIINTASIQSFEPSGQLLAYATTKSAIVGFTKALARLVGKQGIRVNAVAPGPVWTPLIPSTMPEEKVKRFGKNTVFERPAQPAEMAPLYVLLASHEASYVTGEVYGATGGRSPF
jgi:NAD(P)-dependent dehydrogenase (short-subunit alcohol dehydrogenase family)